MEIIHKINLNGRIKNMKENGLFSFPSSVQREGSEGPMIDLQLVSFGYPFVSRLLIFGL